MVELGKIILYRGAQMLAAERAGAVLNRVQKVLADVARKMPPEELDIARAVGEALEARGIIKPIKIPVKAK
jgi:ribosomal protein L31E